MGGIPMSYVDGFIVAVPKKNLEAYRSLAKKAGKVWREHGALEYCEWVAEDVKVGKRTSFPRSVKLKPGETVVFSWITYKSRAQRDRVNAKVMADKRLAGMMDTRSLPFDAKRMIYGGFLRLAKALSRLMAPPPPPWRRRLRRSPPWSRLIFSAPAPPLYQPKLRA